MPSIKPKTTSRRSTSKGTAAARSAMPKPITAAAFNLVSADARSLWRTMEESAKQWRARLTAARKVAGEFAEPNAVTDADRVIQILEHALAGAMTLGSVGECHACKGVNARVSELLPTLRAPFLHKMQDMRDEAQMYSSCLGQLASLFRALEDVHDAHRKPLAELGNYTATSFAGLFGAIQMDAQAFINEHAPEAQA